MDVWNRACAGAGEDKTLALPGDRALADMVLAHSLAMNGGVLHAVESLSPNALAAAVNGYRYFGLDEAASILEHIAWEMGRDLDGDAVDFLEADADERYAAAVLDDDVLVAAFDARYDQDPADFAPLA